MTSCVCVCVCVCVCLVPKKNVIPEQLWQCYWDIPGAFSISLENTNLTHRQTEKTVSVDTAGTTHTLLSLPDQSEEQNDYREKYVVSIYVAYVPMLCSKLKKTSLLPTTAVLDKHSGVQDLLFYSLALVCSELFFSKPISAYGKGRGKWKCQPKSFFPLFSPFGKFYLKTSW